MEVENEGELEMSGEGFEGSEVCDSSAFWTAWSTVKVSSQQMSWSLSAFQFGVRAAYKNRGLSVELYTETGIDCPLNLFPVYSMLNVIVVHNLPALNHRQRDMPFILLAFVRVFHSLLASRAVLHIHQVNEPHDNAFQTTSDIQFGTQTGIEYGDISTLQPESEQRSPRTSRVEGVD
ncbi:hypothetical protein L218DRAFT_945789 [Marasmius fiardii PR-910]|nr:hypothetical protein L218DRAFT_945789 [Marasmius fiardii PR-910]